MNGIIAADWYDIAARAKRAANEVPAGTPTQPLAGTGGSDANSFAVHIGSVGVSSLNSPAALQGAAGLSGAGA